MSTETGGDPHIGIPIIDQKQKNVSIKEIPDAITIQELTQGLSVGNQLDNAEHYSGAQRMGEEEWEKKNGPSVKKEFGVLPHNTRTWREINNLLLDLKTPIAAILIIFGLRLGGEKWATNSEVSWRNNQLAPGMAYLLDPQKNQSGEQIRMILTDYAKNVDLDNKESWPNNSEVQQVTGAWKTFWDMVSEPEKRKELTKTLPDGSAKDILESLPNRKLTDQEIEQLLIEKGVTKENAHLFEQIVVEVRNGTGKVTEALKSGE